MPVSYEFHPLFRQFLLAQAEIHLDREILQTLKRQGGRLLAEAGEGDSAVALLSATEDWTTLAELIRTHGAELEKQGRLLTLQQWIDALPESERGNDPWLLYWAGIALVSQHINNETCIILSHAHPVTRSLQCDRPNCILPTRIES
jgi:ATP/maltotriose-dependent transcriptional regulator MalT